MDKKYISLIAILLVIVLGTGAYLLLMDDTLEETPANGSEEISIAKQSDDEVTESEEALSVENTNLVAVGPISGNGTGTATRIFENSLFIHTVVAEIPSPPTGKFYEGWLVQGSQFFSTGRMTIKDGSYYLEYKSSIDQSLYNEVVITQETEANGLDGIPEIHILEGSF